MEIFKTKSSESCGKDRRTEKKNDPQGGRNPRYTQVRESNRTERPLGVPSFQNFGRDARGAFNNRNYCG